MPRSGSGGAAPRTAHELARQRRVLQPLAQRSFLVKEVAATSQDLGRAGDGGLAALRRHRQRGSQLDRGRRDSSPSWNTEKAEGPVAADPAPAVQN